MRATGPLARYQRRRDFSKTAEPEGRLAEPPSDGPPPSYVVQIHDARSMHFDFRLEAGGVLKSFAVPKGPSRGPHDKRLATPTEDHPLEYRDFEGVIPDGEYGGGAVIVWDEGTYRNLSSDRASHEIPLADALEKGHASFWLDGRKLHGGYSLTRIRTAHLSLPLIKVRTVNPPAPPPPHPGSPDLYRADVQHAVSGHSSRSIPNSTVS